MLHKISLIFFITFIGFAQTFQRVEVGPVVEDGGDSRAVNWIDYDNDGDLDLFITNGLSGGENNFFYINNGDETFTKVTDLAIVQDNSPSDGSTWGDVNNDGYLDLYVVNWYGARNKFYLNNGDGTFSEVTGAPINANNSYSETAAWGDFDNDGLLDIYIANSGGTRRNLLFQNSIDNDFSKITSGSQATDARYTRDVDWIDINNDGFLDIYAVNESNQDNNLYLNNGDGTFEKVTDFNIVNDGKDSWSSNWVDYDNDGDLDLFITSRNGQANSLYKNNGDATFTEITENEILNDIGYASSSEWGDIDNDGDLDLYITKSFANSEEDNLFYLNNGDGTFTQIENEITKVGGWTFAASFGDYNRDGYLDLALAKCFSQTENNALFLNNGGGNNWVVIKPVGKLTNRSGIGSVIRLKATINGKDVWQTRTIEGQNGYCAQNLEAHFGLGDAESIDSLIITWPNGIQQVVNDVAINQVNTIEEDITLDISENNNKLKKSFTLFQNYPNPFNPSTTINFSLSQAGSTRLVIYDILGNEVIELINQHSKAGLHAANWNGKNDAGQSVSSGIYFYTLTADNKSITKKMFLIK